MEWSVAVTRAGSEPFLDPAGDEIDEALSVMGEVLADDAPAFSVAPDRYTVRLAVSAPEALKAVDYALGQVLAAAERAGMNHWPVVNVEVTEWDEFERRLQQPTYPSLLGVTELAGILGVSRQRASELARSSSFPAPFVELAAGPVWIEDNVRHFCETWERRPGRPKTKRDEESCS